MSDRQDVAAIAERLERITPAGWTTQMMVSSSGFTIGHETRRLGLVVLYLEHDRWQVSKPYPISDLTIDGMRVAGSGIAMFMPERGSGVEWLAGRVLHLLSEPTTRQDTTDG